MNEIFIPVRPVPASRARISKYGNYYGKNYTQFRREMYAFLKTIQDKHPVVSGEYIVDIECICKKPKTTKRTSPRGDIDNFVKGILDSLTYANMFWEDDMDIVGLYASKRYQEEGEEYGIRVRVESV